MTDDTMDRLAKIAVDWDKDETTVFAAFREYDHHGRVDEEVLSCVREHFRTESAIESRIDYIRG